MNPSEIQPKINEMVRRIVAKFRPEKIILFGSYARGTAGPDSDVDLLVVMPSGALSRREQAVQIRCALYEFGIPKDVIVATAQEVERCRNLIGHIIRPAMREGKVLYERLAA